MRSGRLTIIIGLLSMALLIAAACTSDAPGPREPTPEFNPTPAGGAAATATIAPEPAATTPPAASTGPAGDAVNGKTVFTANGCSACHSTGTDKLIGPGLAGVLERAATRVEGISAEEYIEQSIRDPGAFVVTDFSNLMPTSFGSLPDSDIQDLIAYLATLN